MPNWCENSVIITGDTEDIQEYYDALTYNKGDAPLLTFQELVPMPESEKDPIKWSNENWGTKWDLDEFDSNPVYWMEDECRYEFNTAWAPPLPFFHTISSRFPKLLFKIFYAEYGMMFGGEATYENGIEELKEYQDEEFQVFAESQFGYEFEDEGV